MFDMDMSSKITSTASSGTDGDNTTGGLGASLNLSNANIQGHTINDGLNAQETAMLFNSIAGNAVNSISNRASNIFNNITNSNAFKVAVVGIVAFVAYKIFFNKRNKR